MKIPSLLAFSFASALLVIPARADVTAVNINLDDTNPSYTVPAGKVLLLEHLLWRLEPDNSSQRISFRFPGAGNVHQQIFSSEEPDITSYARPLRLSAGVSVSTLKNSAGADWRDVTLIGLLVDPEDLYAAKIPFDLDGSLNSEGTAVAAAAKFSSPRPRAVKVVSSTNLEDFTEEEAATVTETADPSIAMVSAPVSGARSFVSLEAVAREVE